MVPKEKGAYGQAIFPIATALIVGHPGLASMAFAIACVAGFLAHEPALVLLGQRGQRAKRTYRPQAIRWLMAYGLIALLAGLVGFLSGPSDAKWATAIACVLTLLAIAFAVMGRERSTLGEVLAAVAITSWSLPTALAAKISWESAFTLAIVFGTGFAVATVAVKGLIRVHKNRAPPSTRRLSVILPSAALGLAALCCYVDGPSCVASLALVPPSLVSLATALTSPPLRHLRTIGWALVSAFVLSMVMLVVGLRG